MLNNVSLMGRLTKDIDLRKTGSGKSVISFTIACDRDFGTDKKCDFISIVAWEKTAEFVSKYFSKGDMIALVGRITTRDWMDDAGTKHYQTEVLADHAYFCGGRRNESAETEFVIMDDDGELPFD